jgi:hypothetical protein
MCFSGGPLGQRRRRSQNQHGTDEHGRKQPQPAPQQEIAQASGFPQRHENDESGYDEEQIDPGALRIHKQVVAETVAIGIETRPAGEGVIEHHRRNGDAAEPVEKPDPVMSLLAVGERDRKF